MKHAHLYLITKSQQHVHTESITDEPPSRVALESPISYTFFFSHLYIFRCNAVICLSDDAALLFFSISLGSL